MVAWFFVKLNVFYGRHVSTDATLQGGFLPVFRDVLKSHMHAVSEIGALVEWLQERITFGCNSTDNLACSIKNNQMYGIFTYIYHILPLKTTKCR